MTNSFSEQELSKQAFIETRVYRSKSLSKQEFIEARVYRSKSLSKQEFIETRVYRRKISWNAYTWKNRFRKRWKKVGKSQEKLQE